jgi:acyl CoA:acetate/3-ketoacid CoA transferase
MNILNEIKSGISRLLGVHKTVEIKKTPRTLKSKRITKRGRGRPKGMKIPRAIVDAVLQADKSISNKQLAAKYRVSYYWVWSVRTKKLRLKR